MNNRTMVTVYADQDSLSIRTRSRKSSSPQRFILLQTELQRLEKEKYLVTKDIRSFAVLRLCDTSNGDKMLEIEFTWLQTNIGDGVSGYTERVKLPYEKFHEFAWKEKESVKDEKWRMLSLSEKCSPRIEFQSSKNLKAVAENAILRHKLGKFLSTNFRWHDYERIVLSDDFLPYSFFFEGYTMYGRRICGGVILHGKEDLITARYGLHT